METPKWKANNELNATIITFIQAYMFISFQEIFPPILLFCPIFLLVFQKISGPTYSFIRNRRLLGTLEYVH